jgi:hypothetical protein
MMTENSSHNPFRSGMKKPSTECGSYSSISNHVIDDGLLLLSYIRITCQTLFNPCVLVLFTTEMHQVFTNRWSVFHVPDMTVTFKLHPEICRLDTDKGVETDFDEVITDLVETPGTPQSLQRL